MTKTEFIFKELNQNKASLDKAVFACFENHYNHTKHTDRPIEDSLAAIQ